MKTAVLLFLIASLYGWNVNAAEVLAEAGRVSQVQDLFAKIPENKLLLERMSQLPNAELMAIRKVFIPEGRGSHTNFEITFGVPDGTGDYSEVTCFPLTLIQHRMKEGDRDKSVNYFVAAADPCQL